jgi:hypothetical protein
MLYDAHSTSRKDIPWFFFNIIKFYFFSPLLFFHRIITKMRGYEKDESLVRMARFFNFFFSFLELFTVPEIHAH